MAWRCVAAVGLKPPPRGHVVATGWVAAMMGRWRGRASGLAPVSDKANDAVEVAEDRGDQELVVDVVLDELSVSAPNGGRAVLLVAAGGLADLEYLRS